MSIAELDTLSDELLSLESTSRVPVDDVVDTLQTVYKNGYFTNHGPLAKEFESRLERYLGVRNVVAVGNESLALLIATLGIEPGTHVVAPRYGGALISQLAIWLKLGVSYSDVSVANGCPSFDDVLNATTPETRTVFLKESWGHRIPGLVDELVSRSLKVVLIAFESFGAKQETDANSSDQVVTLFSFGPQSLLSTLQGGAIATDNDDWAARFRNTRSSYGARQKVDVKATCNGRFSELQAGLGIRSLAKLPRCVDRCKEIHTAMMQVLQEDHRVESVFQQRHGVANYVKLPILLKERSKKFCSMALPSDKDLWPISAELTERTVSFPVSKFKSVEHGMGFANQFLDALSD
jgi:dTDP-4-amino-4,6-dideoxygalactose transaminase